MPASSCCGKISIKCPEEEITTTYVSKTWMENQCACRTCGFWVEGSNSAMMSVKRAGARGWHV